MVRHSGFPVSECVKGYLCYSRVFQFDRVSFALMLVAFSHRVLVDAEDVVFGFGKFVEHVYEFGGYGQGSRVASFFGCNAHGIWLA